MIFRLKTSKRTEEKLLELKAKTNITPNILARYAICMSLLNPTKPEKFNFDNNGLELNRQILTGKYDSVFKALIIQYAEEQLSDEDYFPKHIKAHLERGIALLYSEYDFAGNTDKFIVNLANYKFDLASSFIGGK